VVVRDSQGNVIDNLKKEDFQLLDNNKPQVISTFAMERPSTHTIPVATDESASPSETMHSSPGVVLPDRFVALVFDDIHLNTEDAVLARNAASKILDSATATDVVAIYSTSGIINQNFTKDLAVLRNMLLRVIPRPLQGGGGIKQCPHISYFQAERMLDFHDSDATNAADFDAWACAYNEDPKAFNEAVKLALTTAQQLQNQGVGEIDALFQRFSDFVRRLSGMPGQRILAFISPGFASDEATRRLNEAIDRAVKSNVIVDTVDARGLYTPDLGDLSQPASMAGLSGGAARFHMLEQSMAGEVLGSLAHGTGGTWFHNRNDLDRALRDIVSAPAVSYVLSFSPQNLKLDGRYHSLKVTVGPGKNLAVQARHGYFAPKTAPDPASQAQAEIEEALMSQDELNELPIELKTQFFMKDASDASLSVLAHVDLKSLHFHKAGGRNFNEVVVAAVIFDQNGQYIAGDEKTLKVRMLDATLASRNNSGATIKYNFNLKPGTYLLRLVARDTEGAQMAARNGAIVIPN
jgi:VWFA-related protein